MSRDFLKALLVPVYLILLINLELKILTPWGTLVISTILKVPFLSNPLSSFRWDSTNKGSLAIIVRVLLSYREINISAAYC